MGNIKIATWRSKWLPNLEEVHPYSRKLVSLPPELQLHPTN